MIAPPSDTTVEKATSVTFPVARVELPRTVLVSICSIFSITRPLSLTVTKPSVTVICAESKLDNPLAACLTAAVPVGAAALELASVIDNLLCSISAVALTSAFMITPGLICASNVCAVESMFKLMSPTILVLIAALPSPVNVRISLALRFSIVNSWKLENVMLLKFTASWASTGSLTLIILLSSKFIAAFIAN